MKSMDMVDFARCDSKSTFTVKKKNTHQIFNVDLFLCCYG